ncbi:MAG: bifunctional DNA primase/polymerase [Solirubrobacterales bacterium]
MPSKRRQRDDKRGAELLRAALGYAEIGIPVFPLYGIGPSGRCRCGQPTCPTTPGKHPAVKWGTQATTDPKRLTLFLRPQSRDGIGAVAGNGFLVLDFDPKHGGLDALAEIQDQHEAFPLTTKILTGDYPDGRGIHLWFRASRDLVTRSRPLEGYEGVDVRAHRGVAILPPTRHKSGVNYEVEVPFSEMTDAPAWVLDLVGQDEQQEREKAEGRKLSGIPISAKRRRMLRKGGIEEGQQRAFLCGSARALIETGKHDYDSATEALMNALAHSDTDPSWEWTEDEVRRIVADIDRSPRPKLKEKVKARKAAPRVVGYSGRRSR